MAVTNGTKKVVSAKEATGSDAESKPKKPRMTTQQQTNGELDASQNGKKRLKLIDSDDDDEDNAAAENESTLRLLESKVNLSQKKANKVVKDVFKADLYSIKS